MDASIVIEHVFFSLLGLLAYHAICILGKIVTSNGQLEYSGKKAARLPIAMVINIIYCTLIGWVPVEGIGWYNLLVLGMGGCFMIDHALKIVCHWIWGKK